MPEIYWYISKAKIDLLKDQVPSFFAGIAAKLEFKLPFVSGSLSGTATSTLINDLKRVSKALRSEQSIRQYHELRDDEAPVILEFEGPAMRHVDDNGFWLAMEREETALLLAGSASYMVGRTPKTETSISPSMDPVGAFRAAFQTDIEDTDRAGPSLSVSLSYAWQEIMRGSVSGGVPRVEGLAVFARMVAADKQRMQDGDRQRIRRLVIGTPLYVRQV